MGEFGIEYQEKDKNKVKTDKTGHEIEKSAKIQSQRRTVFHGPTRAYLMGRLGDPKHFDWFRDVAANQRSRSNTWRQTKIEVPRNRSMGKPSKEPRSFVLLLYKEEVTHKLRYLGVGEFSVARTPHQNGIAERKNRTLIEAARTMLADSKLPTTFWAEAVNTACYVQNRVLVIKPHNKTPYELFLGRKPALNFIRPFGCHVTILNTLDHLGNQTNGNAELRDEITNDVGKNNGVKDPTKEDDINGLAEATNTNNTNRLNIVSSPVNTVSLSFTTADLGRARDQRNEFRSVFGQDKDANSTYMMFTPVSAAESCYENLGGSTPVNAATPSNVDYPTDPLMPDLEDTVDLQDTGIFGNAYDNEDVGVEADLNNLETTMSVSPIPTTRIHKDHPKEQIIGDINSATQTRRMIKMSEEHAIISYINKQRRTNHKDYQNCLFASFLSQMKPKKVIQALADSIWVEAMQEELLQFRNKKDEREIVVRNKARLVTQGYTQEEGIDYDEVFAPVARIEAITLFLAYASFMGFIVHQMDVKSTFLYGIIEEEVYVCQPPGCEDPQFLNNVYKVDKALYGLNQAPRAWTKFDAQEIPDEFYGELTFFLGLQVKQKDDGIFISKDKYVADILKKFDFSSVKIAGTPLETNKELIKDEEAEDMDVHLYRSMIGSLMYLTASRPDIMFVVCACARFQVTPKTSHLYVVKRIFRYLKGQPKLGLWYPKDSPFDLEAFLDSDYAGSSFDRKSTTGGCQFLGKRLISWQCKKQIIVANSTTEVEYVAAANCCG
ncbi:putative ribonuclease H-like domain-containing protein [Tanacetum coccineum]|uniref:Ribonuclease H-like domain-containing protein n=1 Tax=Tanacetum coccineum TaxID=301880 RepID=A0ABQ5DIZ1_9ASTR